jgi:hypothetical protein
MGYEANKPNKPWALLGMSSTQIRESRFVTDRRVVESCVEGVGGWGGAHLVMSQRIETVSWMSIPHLGRRGRHPPRHAQTMASTPGNRPRNLEITMLALVTTDTDLLLPETPQNS